MSSIPQGFKPNLAANADLDKLDFETRRYCASAKLDGIRATCFGGVLYSRSLKPIPNKFIQQWAAHYGEWLEGYDGELIIGSPSAENVFQATTSGVMSIEGQPDFKFFVFDKYYPNTSFVDRYETMRALASDTVTRLCWVNQIMVKDRDHLNAIEAKWLAMGFEGLMLRDMDSEYKCGRSTARSQEILKVKQFVHEEFKVVGYEELMTNENEAKTNELGQTERSTSKAGLVPAGVLGALVVEYGREGKTFNVGSGFTLDQRKDLWKNKNKLIGKLVRVKYFPVGMVDKPRFPIFDGFRDEKDL